MKNEAKLNLDEIISQAIRGKVEAQETLFKYYYSTMMNICFRYADGQAEAKDMLQDGFIRILQSLKTFNFEGSFEGWMKKIMVHSSIDYIRKNRKHITVSIDDVQDVQLHSSNTNDAVEMMSAKELMNLLNSLPTMSKTVFNLFIFDGFSHAEIAKKLNIKEGTSMWHVNNARTLMKSKIAKLYKMEEVSNG